MRVTIIPEDGLVSVDKLGFGGIDLSFIPSNVHAVQWYGNRGFLEIKDVSSGNIVENQEISDFSAFQQAIDSWNQAKLAYEAQLAVELAKAEEVRKAEEEAKRIASSSEETIVQ